MRKIVENEKFQDMSKVSVFEVIWDNDLRLFDELFGALNTLLDLGIKYFLNSSGLIWQSCSGAMLCSNVYTLQFSATASSFRYFSNKVFNLKD